MTATLVHEQVATGPEAADPATRRRWTLGGISLSFYVVLLLQQPGRIIADTKLNVAMTPGEWIGRTFNLWQSSADLGVVQNQAVGYLFPMAPFFWVGNHLAPVWVVQRCWIATVLLAAFLGTVLLADRLRLGTFPVRVVLGLFYALSPFFVARAGNTSGLVLGGALLPWILLPLVRASQGGSLRRCGLASGVAVLFAGGINAAVTLAVLIAPLTWILTRRRSRDQVVLGAWWLLGVTLAVTWWAAPLLFQSRYGFDFLPYTEQPSVTTGYASNVEILRGVADWLQYLNLGTPWIRSGYTLVSQALPIAATGVIAAIGIYGLSRRDLPERRFLGVTFLVAVTVMAAGFGGRLGNPFAQSFQDFLGGAGGPFRNIYKFQPLVLLPLALGAGHALSLLTARLWVRGELRRTTLGTPTSARQGRRIRRRAGAPVAALLVVTGLLTMVGAAPIWRGTLTSAGGFSELPSWWGALASWQKTLPAHGRILIVPGANNGSYTWGEPQDEPADVLGGGPYAVRNLVPLGSPAETRVLDAVEHALAVGGSPALNAYLARIGITHVVARNDLDWERWNTPRPAIVNGSLLASGLVKVRSFGPSLPLPFSGDDVDSLAAAGSAAGGSSEQSLHALEVYRVPVPTGLVRSYPASRAVQVSGSPEGLLSLLADGLVASDQAALLASDPLAPGSAGSRIEAARIETDSLTHAAIDPGLPNTNRSYPLPAGQQSAAGGLTDRLNFLPFPTAGQESTAGYTGEVAGVTASSYGSWLYQIPEARPAAAMDGDPSTAWVTGTPESSRGQWLQVNFRRPVPVSAVQVSLLADGPWRPAVQTLRVTTENGSQVEPVQPVEQAQRVAAPAGSTRFLRIELDGLAESAVTNAGAGIREITIPGVTGKPVLDLPAASVAGQPAPAAYSFTRQVNNPRDPLRLDPEKNLDRRFEVPAAQPAAAQAWGAGVPSPQLLTALDRAQRRLGGGGGLPPVTVTTSSTFQNLPNFRAPNVLDGSTLTAWAPQPPGPGVNNSDLRGTNTLSRGSSQEVAPRPQNVDTDPSLTLTWSAPRTLDRLGLQFSQGFSTAGVVHLSSPQGTRDVAVAPNGALKNFAALRTNTVTLTFRDVRRAVLRTSLGKVALPVALTGVSFPALADLRPTPLYPATPISVGCGSGPAVSLNGRTTQFGVTTTAQDVMAGKVFRLTPCGSADVTLAKGQNTMTTTAGDGAFNLRELVLRPAGAASATPGPAPSRTTKVLSWGDSHRVVSIAAGAAAYLAVNENENKGWVAELAGRPLTAVRLDGWRQGFVVPAGVGGEVTLTYGPTAPYRLVLLVGLGRAVLLLLLAAIPARHRHRPAMGPAEPSRWWFVAGALVVSVVVGGWLALATPLALWLAWRRRNAFWPWAAGLAMVLATAAVALEPGRLPQSHSGAFGIQAQLAATLAIILFAAAFTQRTDPHPLTESTKEP